MDQQDEPQGPNTGEQPGSIPPEGEPFRQPEPPSFEPIPSHTPEPSPQAAPPPPVYEPPPSYSPPPISPQQPPAYPPPGAGAYYGAVQPGFPPPLEPAGTFGDRLTSSFTKMADVVTHPSAERFAANSGGADWAIILILLVGLGLLEGIASYISRAIYGPVISQFVGLSQFPDAQRRLLQSLLHPQPSLGSIIGVPIGFLIASGFLWLIAKIFGGTGTFLKHSWLLALAYVPITAASTVIGLIPFLGGFIALALGIFGIILNIFAIAAAHQLSMGRAAAVVLIPLALILVLAICAFAVLAAALISGGFVG